MEEAFADPQVKYNWDRLVLSWEASELDPLQPGRKLSVPGSTISVLDGKGESRKIRPPPRLGQHTEEVLREEGLSAEEISELAERVIVQIE